MSTTTRFDGVFTALVTPFTSDMKIDWSAFDALIDRQLAAGIHGLVPVGTTGEAATLTEDEAVAVIERTVRRTNGRAYVLAGTGSNSTEKTIKATKRAANAGADGVLLVTPYYNKPSQAGLIAHYEAVASCASLDNVLYSVPGRAGIAISTETAAQLSNSCANIVAIKEAGGDAARVTDLRLACNDDFVVHCGDDGLALAFYVLGARGLTSVLSNYDPEICVAIYAAWKAGDVNRALALTDISKSMADVMFIDSSPSPVKYVTSKRELMKETTRLPLVGLSVDTKKIMDGVIQNYQTSRDQYL
jgi:4-hydroxy-tetrahydrodipicolinate synthase